MFTAKSYWWVNYNWVSFHILSLFIFHFRALQEAQDIFGVDFDYDEFDKYDQEDEEYEEDEDYQDEDEPERRYSLSLELLHLILQWIMIYDSLI